MDICYFENFMPEYNIPCKVYTPDVGTSTSIVVGVHGFGGDKESSALYALAEKLTAGGSALLCFDFPAHGTSPAVDEMLTVDNCIRDLLAVCDYAKSRFPGATLSIFATSFGGYITLLSLKHLHPLPAQLILRAPAVCMAKVFRERILQDGFAAYQETGRTVCGFERTMDIPYSFYEDLIRHNAMETTITVPTLLIRAGQDELIDADDLAEFCLQNPTVRLIDIPTAGHRFKGYGELNHVIRNTLAFYENDKFIQ